MTKSRKIREVFAELRSAYGGDVPARELLECAMLLVNASEENLYDPKISNREGRIPFSQLPVNLVMENYSWKLMNREVLWEDDYSPRIPRDMLIEQCLSTAA